MNTHSLPIAFMARTNTSVCTDSTMWPRCRLPFAYGSAWVTRMREAISRALYHESSAADLDEEALHRQSRVGPVFQVEVHLGAADQAAPPERPRTAASALVTEPGRERVRDLLFFRRQLRFQGGEQLGLELVVSELPRSGARIAGAVRQRPAHGAGDAAEKGERHRGGIRLPPQVVREKLERLGHVAPPPPPRQARRPPPRVGGRPPPPRPRG